MTDSSGNIQARYDYDPYGRATQIQGTLASDFQYAGYYEHTTSGLNLTLFRAYDPNTAKWLARDPLGEQVGPNLYAYVSNDPLNFIDPLGLVNLDLQSPADPNSATMQSVNPAGQYSVNAHGGSSYVQDDRNDPAGSLHSGPGLSPADLLAIMKKNGYKGGPITLYGCNNGQGPNSFAQRLANLANATVTAPNMPYWPYNNTVAPELPNGTEDPDPSHRGQMVPFAPTGSTPALPVH